MKYLIIILLFPLFVFAQSRYELSSNPCLLEVSEEVLRSQIGLKEKTGHNDGEHVKKYLLSVGIKTPAPYCQAGQYWCFVQACDSLGFSYDLIPIPKSGLAISSFNYAKKHGKKVKYIAKQHDLFSWKISSGWSGHVERIVQTIRNSKVITGGFNTSNGLKGSQNEGNCNAYRLRSLRSSIGNLKVYGLVGFK